MGSSCLRDYQRGQDQSVTGTTIRVENARVTNQDINAADGVIHKVDSVLASTFNT
ncbi:MAG: fasciclin domain-containing protein [Halobacteriota archaeon]